MIAGADMGSLTMERTPMAQDGGQQHPQTTKAQPMSALASGAANAPRQPSKLGTYALLDLGAGTPKIPMPAMGQQLGPSARGDMTVQSIEFQ